MKELIESTRDIARELARKYSTMTHDELDILESILVRKTYHKGEIILAEGDICREFLYIHKGMLRQFYFKKDKHGYVYRKSVQGRAYAPTDRSTRKHYRVCSTKEKSRRGGSP